MAKSTDTTENTETVEETTEKRAPKLDLSPENIAEAFPNMADAFVPALMAFKVELDKARTEYRAAGGGSEEEKTAAARAKYLESAPEFADRWQTIQEARAKLAKAESEFNADIADGVANVLASMGDENEEAQAKAREAFAASHKALSATLQSLGSSVTEWNIPRIGKTKGSSGSAPSNPDMPKIRKWAQDKGHDVKDRGRVPAEIVEEYYSQH